MLIEGTVALTTHDEASEPLTEYSTDSGNEQQVGVKQGSEALYTIYRSQRIAQCLILKDATVASQQSIEDNDTTVALLAPAAKAKEQ